MFRKIGGRQDYQDKISPDMIMQDLTLIFIDSNVAISTEAAVILPGKYSLFLGFQGIQAIGH